MGRELSTIVRDLPVELDLEAARLGDYDRDDRRPAVPRVRVPDADRAAAADGRRVRRASGPTALRAVAQSGSVPAARVAGRPDRRLGSRPGRRAATRGRRAAAVARLRRRRDGPRRRRRRRTARRGRRRRSRTAPSSRPSDLPTALAAAIVDPGRIEVVGAGRHRRARAVARRAAGRRRRRSLLDDPRPRRGTPLALAVAGADGRVVAAEGAEAADALRRLLERLGTPLVGHEVKPLLVARFADDPRRRPHAGRVRHPDRGLHPQRRAAQPDDRRRRRRAARPDPAAGRRAAGDGPGRPRGAVRARRPRAARAAPRRRRPRPAVPRDRAAADPGPRPDGGRRRRARPRGAGASSSASSAPRSRGSSRRSTSTSATSSTSAAPSSSSRSCSSSSNLPKGKRTKTGYSTDASVLEDLRPAHPMIDKLLEWRIYTKLRSTYVEALPTLIGRRRPAAHDVPPGRRRDRPPVVVRPEPPEHPDPDRARPADPAGVRGRRARPRRCSPPTTSQIELRILAHVSGDEHLKDAFARQRRHPPRDRRPGAPQGPGRRHHGRAVDGQDGQLRARLRDERLRAVVAGRTSRAQEAQEFINTLLRGVLRDQLLHDARSRSRRETQGYVDDAPRPQAADPRAAAREPGAARRRRADGDQHADPGHGRRHHEDRDDPARPSGCATAGFRARLLLPVHDELLLEVPRDEVERLVAVVRETMEGALPLSTCRSTVDVKVGDDWESMTPLTRADAIAAEADELPLEAPVAPLAGVGRRHARASRGRDRRARPAAAPGRRDDRRRARRPGPGRCGRTTRGVRRRRSPADGRGGRPARQAARHRAVRRRRADDPPQDDRPAVRRARGHARGPVRPARPRARRRPRAAVPRHPQVRARSGCTAATRSPASSSTEVGGARGLRRRSGRSRSTRRSRCATSGAGCAAGRAGSSRCCSTSRSWPASATSTPTRRCGGRGSTRCGPPRRSGRPTSAACTRRSATILAEAVERRGSLDRRLHGARRRRLDAGAPRRLPADRRAVPALRPADQADRDRRAVDALLLVVPAPAGRRPRRARAAILRTMTGGPRRPRAGAGRSSTAEGSVGLTPTRRPVRAGHGRERTKRAAATRRAAARASAAGRLMSILRLDGRDPRGRHVRHPRRRSTRAIALGDRIGLVGPERRRQDDAAADRRRARRAGPRRRSIASAA